MFHSVILLIVPSLSSTLLSKPFPFFEKFTLSCLYSGRKTFIFQGNKMLSMKYKANLFNIYFLKCRTAMQIIILAETFFPGSQVQRQAKYMSKQDRPSENIICIAIKNYQGFVPEALRLFWVPPTILPSFWILSLLAVLPLTTSHLLDALSQLIPFSWMTQPDGLLGFLFWILHNILPNFYILSMWACPILSFTGLNFW